MADRPHGSAALDRERRGPVGIGLHQVGSAGVGLEWAGHLHQAFTTKVNLGFWRGAQMNDPQGLLVGSGRSRHLSLHPGEALPEEPIRNFVRQAVILNRLMGSPARRG